MFQKTPWSKSPCWLLLLCTFEPWMQSELMTRILQTLNTRMKNAGRNIILFLDNAPCHPRELINMFSNIEVAFLPKNATSVKDTVPRCTSNQELACLCFCHGSNTVETLAEKKNGLCTQVWQKSFLKTFKVCWRWKKRVNVFRCGTYFNVQKRYSLLAQIP